MLLANNLLVLIQFKIHSLEFFFFNFFLLPSDISGSRILNSVSLTEVMYLLTAGLQAEIQ